MIARWYDSENTWIVVSQNKCIMAQFIGFWSQMQEMERKNGKEKDVIIMCEFWKLLWKRGEIGKLWHNMTNYDNVKELCIEIYKIKWKRKVYEKCIERCKMHKLKIRNV